MSRGSLIAVHSTNWPNLQSQKDVESINSNCDEQHLYLSKAHIQASGNGTVTVHVPVMKEKSYLKLTLFKMLGLGLCCKLCTEITTIQAYTSLDDMSVLARILGQI